MNLTLVDQHGKAVDINDLPEDEQLNLMNYDLGYRRGWREAIGEVAKASAEGRSPVGVRPDDDAGWSARYVTRDATGKITEILDQYDGTPAEE